MMQQPGQALHAEIDQLKRSVDVRDPHISTFASGMGNKRDLTNTRLIALSL